jgi:hypothetical protein
MRLNFNTISLIVFSIFVVLLVYTPIQYSVLFIGSLVIVNLNNLMWITGIKKILNKIGKELNE